MNDNFPMALNVYQKRQATLLYHFSSMEFLDSIISQVRALTAFSDQTLDYAIRVERDKAMRALGWDEGHLAANWSTHAHPMLNDCLRALLRQKQMRATEWYDISGVSSTLTGMSHFSMNWTLPAEEEKFLELRRDAVGTSMKLDTTINHTWTDLRLASAWEQYREKFPKIPKFRVRTDVEGESGKRPIRTGVYVPQDDPYGTLQFAWTGNNGGALAVCETFSDLAREYLTYVGRDKIWKAPNEVSKKQARGEPTDEYFDDWCRNQKRMKFPDYISSRNERAFVKRPCKWYFVEQITGEFDDDTSAEVNGPDKIRCLPGESVPRSGWWHSPALPAEQGRRHFKQGSTFPEIGTTEWGAVFWYYDAQQQQ
jgi:hypothetical protein